MIYKLDEYKIILKKFPKSQHWESTVINNRLWTNWECFRTENPSWRLEDRIERICTSRRKVLPAVAFPQQISCPAFPAPCKPTGVLTQREYPDPHSGSSCHLAWSCSPHPNVKSLSFHPTQQLGSFCYLEMHLLKLVGNIEQCNEVSDLDHKESSVEWYSLDHEEEDWVESSWNWQKQQSVTDFLEKTNSNSCVICLLMRSKSCILSIFFGLKFDKHEVLCTLTFGFQY